MYKKCTGICGLKLELNKYNFKWRKDRKIWESRCNKCTKIYKFNYYQKNKEKISKKYKQKRKKNKKIIIENAREKLKILNIKTINKIKFRTCCTCKKQKELNKNNFSWYYKSDKIYNPVCKKCINEKNSIKENKNKAKQRIKKWRNNPNNKKRRNKQEKEKLKWNPKLKIKKNILSTIREIIKERNIKKENKSITKSLPYTEQELLDHLESQFEDWMTWDNYGKYNNKIWDDNNISTWVWNIDHIKPESDFNYISINDIEFLECWGLKNLRPYSAKQNIIDGAQRIRHNIKINS